MIDRDVHKFLFVFKGVFVKMSDDKRFRIRVKTSTNFDYRHASQLFWTIRQLKDQSYRILCMINNVLKVMICDEVQMDL